MRKQKKKKVVIRLSAPDIVLLERVVKRGTAKARVITRARILLLSHRGKTNREITEALGCSHDLVNLVRQRHRNRASVSAAIVDLPRPGQPKKITETHEAFVVATACTDAPEGHHHWTLPALKAKLLATYKQLHSVSDERIRQMLLRAALKPWREKNVVHSESHSGVSRAHG